MISTVSGEATDRRSIKIQIFKTVSHMAFNGRRNCMSGNGKESEDDKLKRLQVARV